MKPAHSNKMVSSKGQCVGYSRLSNQNYKKGAVSNQLTDVGRRDSAWGDSESVAL
jgi:hypothetical protein